MEHALKRNDVTLWTGVTVDKIVFDERRDLIGKLIAKGVRYLCQDKTNLVCGREVILCAGVFESPAILERSGIGRKDVLTAANIPVLYDLPGVGENLQDHLNCGLSIEAQDHIPTRDDAIRDPNERKAALAEYERSRTGRLAEGSAYSFAFTPLQMLESPSETQELLDLAHHHRQSESGPGLRAQYTLLTSAITNPQEATATTFLLRSQRHRDTHALPPTTPPFVDGNYLTIVAMLTHPFSRGSCHITSPQPLFSHPRIKFNYLTHPLDTALLSRHVLHIERLFSTTATFASITKLNARRLPRSFPYPIKTLADAKGILEVNSATNYHHCGTCAMSREDLGGVVDAGLRVYGTSGNVRVCDASVLPVIPRGNVLVAVYAWAEKAADLICAEAAAAAAAAV